MKPCVKKIYDDFFVRYPALVPCAQQIYDSFIAMKTCYENGGKVLACGNGGSAADCEHLVGELMNKFATKRPVSPEFRAILKSLDIQNADFLADHLETPLAAISLVSQTALITSVANDINADMIFAQQVLGYGKPGDILIAFSTSGKSPNIINAIQVARACKMTIIGFTGESGGYMNDICQIVLRVPASLSYTIQEYHFPIYHLLCLMIEQENFGNK